MYRITEEMAKYISSNSKNPEVPGVQKDTKNPYTPKNKYSIGLIDRAMAYNSDALYMLEIDADLKGFFLYSNGELKSPDDVIEMLKSHIDEYTTDLESMLDVADCSIQLPDQITKLTGVSITTIESLFIKEPDLKLCLNTPKEKKNGKGFFRRLLKISTFGIFK